MEQEEIKQCLSCNSLLKGRSDKKFCDDFCRNAFNNQLNAKQNNYIRNINNALRRNRNILEELTAKKISSGKAIRELLFNKGFQFQYFTHTKQTKLGNTAYFCYDYGYQSLKAESLKIIHESFTNKNKQNAE